MKPTTLFLFMAITLSCKSGSGSASDPARYHNDIMSVINGNEQMISTMNEAMEAKDYAKAEATRVKWLAATDEQIAKVQKMGPFKNDDSFQKAVLGGLSEVKSVLANDYPKLLSLRKNGTPDESSETKALDNINNTFERLADKVNAASSTFESKYA